MRVLIATPAYGGNVQTCYVTSLLATLETAREAGIEIEVDMPSGESHVGRARNQLAARAVRGEFDVLFFIDADQGWRAEDALAAMMLASTDDGPDVVGAPYALKAFDWARIRELALSGASDEELRRSCSPTGQIERDAPTFEFGPHRFRPAKLMATGFMAIRVSLLRRLAESHTELRYKDAADNTHESGCALFDSMISDGRWLPEDWSFCTRARAIGSRVVALVSAELDHVGQHVFRTAAE